MFCKPRGKLTMSFCHETQSKSNGAKTAMKIINQRKLYTCHLKNMLLASQFKRKFIKIGFFCIILSISILIALVPNIVTKSAQSDLNSGRYKTDLKYILFWKQAKKNKKNFYNRDIEYLPGQTQFINQNCPDINCYLSYNKTLLGSEENFDAVVFHLNDVKKLNSLKLRRKERQIYIFKSQEPAEHHPLCNPIYDNFFNWTWTYKLNSIIPHPFINLHSADNRVIGPKTSLEWVKEMKHTSNHKTKIAGKNKAVAWLVTNCKLKHTHQGFVNNLREELKAYNHTLDTFGPCSPQKCPKGGINKCFNLIEKRYFFNLVLEESFTEDFVTERMVKAMNLLTIPIVSGMTNFSRFLPPGSYINAQEFDVKKLAALIDYLIENPEKYSYFFDWKSYYFYTTRTRSYLCDLCTKMNEKITKKTYKKLRMWWNPDYEETCQKIQIYELFKDTP